MNYKKDTGLLDGDNFYTISANDRKILSLLGQLPIYGNFSQAVLRGLYLSALEEHKDTKFYLTPITTYYEVTKRKPLSNLLISDTYFLNGKRYEKNFQREVIEVDSLNSLDSLSII